MVAVVVLAFMAFLSGIRVLGNGWLTCQPSFLREGEGEPILEDE